MLSDSARLLAGYNELQHKIFAQITHLVYEDAGRYPDEVFY